MREHPESRQYGIADWELGWLAAAIESEGYFAVVRSGIASFYPRVGVANSDREFLERIQRLVLAISGKSPAIKTHADKHRKSYNKTMWRIEINHYGTIAAVCEAILPFLCGKRAVAQLVLELASKGRGKDGKGLSSEERRPYYVAAREFNRSARLLSRKNLIGLDNPQGTVKDSSETNEQSITSASATQAPLAC